MTRIAQVALVLAAAALWAASRITWVEVTSFDGLGQPKTVALAGAQWSTAMIPLAVLLVAAAVAALAVRGWPLRLLALLVAAASAGMAYLAISLWTVGDVAVRASHIAEAPVADLVGSERHYGGAVLTVAAAVVTLAGAVLLMRAATAERSGASRYTRRAATPAEEEGTEMSERMMWDALDEGADPTRDPSDPDTKGR
ncbi:TIGR02234 family membrane protein [Mycolicibacterium pulveris]|uniref:Membrane protein n=1 Tax=Mycolicibacterium pulveris TaxID=36813 RepID=A0A7I7USK4_MYCPV|nr:TIGR02234 family membrane protein [Mycolicibacterium pulveris]MCV6982488.1 TIGR02234 family membrane protein [Mycolicibacterium pulveris]BBY83853.1 membrane protein [Mycolicibacterium pulveris]